MTCDKTLACVYVEYVCNDYFPYRDTQPQVSKKYLHMSNSYTHSVDGFDSATYYTGSTDRVDGFDLATYYTGSTERVDGFYSATYYTCSTRG